MTKKEAVAFYGKETVGFAEKIFKDRFGKNLFARSQNTWHRHKFIEKARKLELDKKELEKVLLEMSEYY